MVRKGNEMNSDKAQNSVKYELYK